MPDKKTYTMAQIVRRLKKSGLKTPAIARAVESVKQEEGQAKEGLFLKPRMRKALLDLVLRCGAIVATSGRKRILKVFTLKGYERMREACRETARKHKPWLTAAGGKKSAVAPVRAGKRHKRKMKKYVHWMHRPENAEKRARVTANFKPQKAAVPA